MFPDLFIKAKFVDIFIVAEIWHNGLIKNSLSRGSSNLSRQGNIEVITIIEVLVANFMRIDSMCWSLNNKSHFTIMFYIYFYLTKALKIKNFIFFGI
jgi:hypothetical protein